MNKKRRRNVRKLNVRNIILFLIILIVGLIFIIKLVKGVSKEIIFDKYYIASSINTVDIYRYDSDTDTMVDVDKVYRGKEVLSNNKIMKIGDISYIEIRIDKDTFYVKDGSLVLNKDDVVKEDTKYVRTSVTVYKNEKDSKINSFIKKGNKLNIVDYDYIDDMGNVNMYKVEYEDISGWVYSKYLVDTESLALENYNVDGVYDIHKDRKYSGRELYGGSASTLDYYPYERVSFEDNSLLKNAKTMYLNAGSNIISNIDKYLEIAKNNGVNAIVVDIKDGALAYSSDVAKEYSMTAYKTAINDNGVYKSAIDKIKDAGIYVIGRIVVFNDVHYGADHPEDCISSSASSRLWPSAYSRGAWEYNVELAKEAVLTMGFNEIQFDYVRFPEDSYKMSIKGNTDFKNKYGEEKAEAVQNFLFYATDQIHKVGAYLSVDVFGECSGSTSSAYVTAYGQYWPAISNIVDAISSMPYTDHFTNYGDNSKSEYWTNAYKTVYNWALGAAKRQTEIPTPAVARTWITAYDTPYWKPTVIYGASKINEQAQALVDAGLDGGFITWNSASSLNKYNQIKEAFSKDYVKK